ncbi:ADP-forming succinate--CoA ligase subunit beta [Hyphomicrobiales bacterium]|jgi:succinyl-CoA synthetase beta subunit|nr:ADP-forming succinate--CoA ligase subunit beta [Rhodobiaceae bacterium]MBT6223183.1 ADP-forming succinate--CoA ligase subunit beta [Rhodobiaceae bacterium]MDB4831073.1 ADP-forming succinate--CoA ligase subunit beta [Hyphomicrobiales bacterium]MDC0139800.1 ADP-forming succinate--CoA ligase subunit beta [Hyphomicrobiales bacterium]MDC3272401.1 ADP-forming succinate--CoA ligase subunit beta [Hyphomicrobiales bacterium]|tara:strand:- start:407 stop:1576 length:1170 start_codon:yes stop_codon:yes gene_type:complete
MNIHEYQAKEIFKKYSIPILDGGVAFSVEQALEVAKTLPGPIMVVKAQIHAGGRGQGGGVKVVKDMTALEAEANNILGMNLITKQTGPQGKIVKRLYIEDGCNIKEELYLSCLVDRKTSAISFIVSSEGGMDIEEVAKTNPEKISKIAIDPVYGIMPFHIRQMVECLGIEKDLYNKFTQIIKNLYELFVENDLGLLEINPFVVTADNDLVCLDAKMNFDSNALYRNPSVLSMRDLDEEDPLEIEASEHGLNYVKLDGAIGCMVNGAGLAMATMDIIKLYGSSPANFLDVGGGANKEQVMNAFKIILSDPNVKGILVNIFGGIMRCEIIAEGIIAAAKELDISVPLVVRLEGTNVEIGKKYLKESGLNVISADNLDDAAKKIVSAVLESI